MCAATREGDSDANLQTATPRHFVRCVLPRGRTVGHPNFGIAATHFANELRGPADIPLTGNVTDSSGSPGVGTQGPKGGST